jgi:ubiquinone/menaquinone biosynthesis C-methylase UbiE
MAGDALLGAEAILLAAQVSPGMHVADFGIGKAGHLIFPASSWVGESGKVYGVDIVPAILAMHEGRRRQYLIHNLDLVTGDFEAGNLAIPEQSLDRIFLVNTAAQLRNPAQALAEMKRLLKTDGLVAVVDWQPGVRHPVAPSSEYRLNPNYIDAQFLRSGYAVSGDFYPSAWHWGRLYKPLDN